MITMVVFVTRKAGLSHEQFVDHWLNRHGPLVLGVPEFMRHVRKYVQHHRAPAEAQREAIFGHVPDYDGVGEIWFDSHAAMKAAFEEARYIEIIRPDEESFIDAGRCLSFLSEEHVMHDELAPAA